MKRLAIIVIILAFLTQAAYLVAANNAEEAYDEDLYGPEAPVIWEKPVRGVIFSHKSHTMEFALDCDECHDGVFEMYAGGAEEYDDFTMDAMYDGKYCGVCHDGSIAFASNTRCTACHIGVRGVERLIGKDGEKLH
ncbi:MAG: cytochrome c3 family protein [Desulfopila sp.]|jgi:c(7)-type cytochrome triheme protein|nr:cytochrome c3 family protein [Desulfopila sp.]